MEGFLPRGVHPASLGFGGHFPVFRNFQYLADRAIVRLEPHAQEVVVRSDGFSDAAAAVFRLIEANDVVAVCCNRGMHRSPFIATLVADWTSRLTNTVAFAINLGLMDTNAEAERELTDALDWVAGVGPDEDTQLDPNDIDSWEGYYHLGHIASCKRILDGLRLRRCGSASHSAQPPLSTLPPPPAPTSDWRSRVGAKKTPATRGLAASASSGERYDARTWGGNQEGREEQGHGSMQAQMSQQQAATGIGQELQQQQQQQQQQHHQQQQQQQQQQQKETLPSGASGAEAESVLAKSAIEQSRQKLAETGVEHDGIVAYEVVSAANPGDAARCLVLWLQMVRSGAGSLDPTGDFLSLLQGNGP